MGGTRSARWASSDELTSSDAGRITMPVAKSLQVIEPRQSGALERLREAWHRRGLLPYFSKRMVEKLYLRTWLGVVWVPLRPILTVVSSVFVFGGVLGVASHGVPYVIFLLVGLSAWQLFAMSALWATRSLELNRRFLRWVYVPRILILLSSLAVAGIYFSVLLLLTLLAIGYFGLVDGELYLELSPKLLIAGSGLLLAMAMAIAIGFFTSIYGAHARDVRFSLQYLLGFWYFLTPVLYPLSEVPESYRWVAEFNPMSAPIQMIQYGVLGVGSVPMTSLTVTLATVAVLGTLGSWFFLRSESAALDAA